MYVSFTEEEIPCQPVFFDPRQMQRRKRLRLQCAANIAVIKDCQMRGLKKTSLRKVHFNDRLSNPVIPNLFVNTERMAFDMVADIRL